jgi:hypothetical protein
MGYEKMKAKIVYNIDGLLAAVTIKGDSISYGQCTTGSGLKRKLFDQLVCSNSYEPFLHTTKNKHDEIISSVLTEYLSKLKQEVMKLSDWKEIAEKIYSCEAELTGLPIKKTKKVWY